MPDRKGRYLVETRDTVPEQEQNSEQNIRYLTFWMDRQLFGVPITEVVQIIGMQEMTELPELPDYIKGIISLRGQIIPIVDARLRFGRKAQTYNDRTCIIITHVRGSDFGLIVDEVDEVTDILPEQISPPPKLNGEDASTYLTGIAQLKMDDSQQMRVVLVLCAAQILQEGELAPIAEYLDGLEDR